jgi:hypothetical protein
MVRRDVTATAVGRPPDKDRIRQRLAKALIVVALATLVPLTVVAQPAAAAWGGGCGTTYSNGIGNWRACVSAIGYGSGRSDGYVTLYPGHAACTAVVKVYRAGFGSPQAVGPTYNCPSGAIQGWHIYGPDFYSLSGQYYSVIWINGQGGYTSGYLHMP